MIKGLFETHLFVENLERSIEFYGKVIGLKQCHYEEKKYWERVIQKTKSYSKAPSSLFWQICIFRKRVGIPLYIVFLHVDYYQSQKKRSDYVKSCILLLIPFWCQIDSWCHVTRKKCQPSHFLRNSCTNSILLSRPWVWVSRDISFLSICENFAVFYVGKIVTLWRPRLDKIQIILT